MTPERAKYIIANRLPMGELKYAFREPYRLGTGTAPIHNDGITKEEHAFILSRWRQLPGWSSFLYVLELTAKGHFVS